MKTPSATYDEKLFAATIACLGFVYARSDYDTKPSELVDVAVELARETLAELGYSRGHA
jgi:hypothetical protein